MIGLLCFVVAVLASPFKTKLRLEAENAVLRHQLIVLRRRLQGVPTANQIRLYWWCSPPRIGRQRMRPTVSAGRDIGASLRNDKWVRVPL